MFFNPRNMKRQLCSVRVQRYLISTTSIGNQTKKSVTLNRLFLRNNTILTSVHGPLWCTILLKLSLFGRIFASHPNCILCLIVAQMKVNRTPNYLIGLPWLTLTFSLNKSFTLEFLMAVLCDVSVQLLDLL